MKKIYLLGIACLLSGTAMAQDYETPQITDFFSQKISPDGSYIVGQDITGTIGYLYSPITKKLVQANNFYPGAGNCVSNNGIIVGQEIATSEMHCGIVINGKVTEPATLKNMGFSSLNAITPDGTRAVGYMANNSGATSYIPFYVNINPNGVASAPIKLDYPKKDLFGEAPQQIIPVHISQDGSTIAGTVVDGSGFYSYPIVYKMDEKGVWSYTLPSEPLFNPDKIAVPKFPEIDWNDPNYPVQPSKEPQKYMTPEEYQSWQEALKSNPNAPFWDYMSDETYAQYEEAVKEYGKWQDEIIGDKLDNYWKAMYQVGKYQMFALNNFALSGDGRFLASPNGIVNEGTTSDNYVGYTTYVFDLEKGTYTTLKSENDWVIPTQIFPNGRVLGVTDPNKAFIPFEAYMCEPGSDSYIKFMTFLENKIPQYVDWIEDNLGNYGIIGYNPDGTAIMGFYVVTGWMMMSDDMSVIAGGYPYADKDNDGWQEGLTYVFYDPTGTVEVEEVAVEAEEEVFNVFNLNGIKVLTTKDKAAVNNLPKGIYIVNGKKLAI